MSYLRHRTLLIGAGGLLLAVVSFGSRWLQSVPAADKHALQQVGEIEHAPIREASGLVASRTHRGVFWTLCDSENPPDLYAIDGKGKLLAEYRLKDAVNVDWESLAIDDAGNLYVGDVGNNIVPGGLPRRWVYCVREPDPAAWRPAEPGQPLAELAIDGTYFYTFPGKRFDVEGTFFHGDSLYLVSKTRDDDARLYRLPLDKERAVELEEVCVLRGIRQATGADLSPDGSRLAVCSYGYAAFFRLDAGKSLAESLKEQEPQTVRFSRTTAEACAWDGADLVLAAEGREIYRVKFPEQPD